MSSQSFNLPSTVLSALLGAVVGGVIAFIVVDRFWDEVLALSYDSEIRRLQLHQEMLIALDQGNAESAAKLLEATIDGEVLLADQLLHEDVDGVDPQLRSLITSTLTEIASYRARPEYERRVSYLGEGENGGDVAESILARYRSDAP